MSFDFEKNILEEDITPSINRDIENSFFSTFTDIVWHHNGKCGDGMHIYSRIERDRCFSAEQPFYSLKPWEYLPGYTGTQLPSLYNGHIFLVFSSTPDFDKATISEDLQPEHRPVVVFRHHYGYMDGGELPGMSLEKQQEYNAQNDTLVFEGVFKAEKNEDGTYRLIKVWNRFYL